jgi:hypothetical protein
MMARGLVFGIVLSTAVSTRVFAADQLIAYVNHLAYYHDFTLGVVHRDGPTNAIYFLSCKGDVYQNLDASQLQLTADTCPSGQGTWPTVGGMKDFSSNAKTWVGVVQNDCDKDQFSISLQDMNGKYLNKTQKWQYDVKKDTELQALMKCSDLMKGQRVEIYGETEGKADYVAKALMQDK